MIPLLTSTAGKVAVGLLAGIAGAALLRPAMVGVVRAGLSVKDATKSAVDSVTTEARKIHAEAKAQHATVVSAEADKVESEITKSKAG